jgi:hypothetical protein
VLTALQANLKAGQTLAAGIEKGQQVKESTKETLGE